MHNLDKYHAIRLTYLRQNIICEYPETLFQLYELLRNHALSCPLFWYRTRFSVHFRHVKPVVGLQERGIVNREIRNRSSVGGSDRGALSAFTSAEISSGWFIHINVSHCMSPYSNCTWGNKEPRSRDCALWITKYDRYSC